MANPLRAPERRTGTRTITLRVISVALAVTLWPAGSAHPEELAPAAGDVAAEGLPGAGEDEEGLRAELSLSALNRYVSRGFRYGGGRGVLQGGVSAELRGLTGSVWANLDLDERSTQSFTARHEGAPRLNEVDLTLGYGRSFGPLTLSAAWLSYDTRYAEPTQELSLTAVLDVPLAPTVSVFRDVAAAPSTYVSVSVEGGLDLSPRARLAASASAGVLAGEGAAWRTRHADGSPGKPYRALHDGSVRLAIELSREALTVAPFVQLTFPLSSAAARRDHNPAGHLEPTLVFGLVCTAAP